MPIMNGIEAMRKIRKIEREFKSNYCKILMISANAAATEISRCLKEMNGIPGAN